jgi:hypothetical protein
LQPPLNIPPAHQSEAMPTKEMIATHAGVHGNINQALIDAIDAAYACSKSVRRVLIPALPNRWCPSCRCIRIKCADVCGAVATLDEARLEVAGATY